MIRLPVMTPVAAAGFCESMQSYAFKSWAYQDELPPHLSDPVPIRASELTPPRTIELLLFKQDAIGSDDISYEVDPVAEVSRLLKAFDRLPEKDVQLNLLNTFLLSGNCVLRKCMSPIFDALVGQFVEGVRLLDPEDWPAQFEGMGVMSYLNAAGALELCGMLDAAEILRNCAPRLSRKEGRADGLVQAAHIWFAEGRMNLSRDYFVAAIEELKKP